jgi:hypothetical protein
MRELCGNTPVAKAGGWCESCAKAALLGCLCGEIKQAGIDSKKPRVKEQAKQRLLAKQRCCVHCNTAEIAQASVSAEVSDNSDESEVHDADGDAGAGASAAMDVDQSETEYSAGPEHGSVEWYVMEETKSDMPLPSCIGKDITMTPKQDKTNHWQGICNEYGWVVDAQEYPKVGEGSRSIARQFLVLIKYLHGMVPSRGWPTHIAIDDACHVKRSVMEMLVNLVKGRADDLSSGFDAWVLLTLAACDMCIDGFHHPNHKEGWCIAMLNPKSRTQLNGLNTQCVEQLWRRMVRSGSMLRYMARGSHRLMYYTLLQYHNEQLLKQGAARTMPTPKTHVSHSAYRDATRMRKAVDDLFERGASSGSGRFTVEEGTEAFAPQLDYGDHNYIDLSIMQANGDGLLDALRASGLLSATKPSPTNKLKAIVFLQDLVASIHGHRRR